LQTVHSDTSFHWLTNILKRGGRCAPDTKIPCVDYVSEAFLLDATDKLRAGIISHPGSVFGPFHGYCRLDGQAHADQV
jgi:hypothetical protein